MMLLWGPKDLATRGTGPSPCPLLFSMKIGTAVGCDTGSILFCGSLICDTQAKNVDLECRVIYLDDARCRSQPKSVRFGGRLFAAELIFRNSLGLISTLCVLWLQ
jgi:hypothetical protein